MYMYFYANGAKVAEASTEREDRSYRHIPQVPSSRDTTVQLGETIYSIQHIRYVSGDDVFKGSVHVDIDLKSIGDAPKRT